MLSYRSQCKTVALCLGVHVLVHRVCLDVLVRVNNVVLSIPTSSLPVFSGSVRNSHYFVRSPPLIMAPGRRIQMIVGGGGLDDLVHGFHGDVVRVGGTG